MTDYLRNVGVSPAVDADAHEWRVRLEVHGAAFNLSPTEARDLAQRLYSFALEISEREEPAVKQLSLSEELSEARRELATARTELEKEREKRQELARMKRKDTTP